MLYYNQFIKENMSNYNDVELPPGYTTANMSINGKPVGNNNVPMFNNNMLNVNNSLTSNPSMLFAKLKNNNINVNIKKVNIIKIIPSSNNINVDIYFNFCLNDDEEEIYFGCIKNYGSFNYKFSCVNMPKNFTNKNHLQVKSIIKNAIDSWICPSEGKYKALRHLQVFNINTGSKMNLEPGMDIMIIKKNINTLELIIMYNEEKFKLTNLNMLMFNYSFSIIKNSNKV
jgi:hypothetical protein